MTTFSRAQKTICSMVAKQNYQWTQYDNNDRAAARSFVLASFHRARSQERKKELKALADALQDGIWQYL
jgi:hypothetical protein